MHHKGPRHIYAWDLGCTIGAGLPPPLIVCASRDPGKGAMLTIEGSIPLEEFESHLDSIPKDTEIVFYSSPSQDATAEERAAAYKEMGYARAAILIGGIDAWNAITSFL